ncbi:translocation/assembly module TamB domain-containing protein [Thalassovita sp.]|uniref:translocation/assembly module TamB domain-containing protein n=1 Tax=Thalassovita sp. TaxID=1979401 RepID=UPI0029DE8FB2|nr:translocation/assembly module TamB domain-containing protein [Thalassovita sp.]
MRKLVLAACLSAPLALSAQDASQPEPGFFEGLLEESLSGPGRVVDVQGFSGALSSTASIQTLTVADANGIWLTLNGVTLNWTRSALLSGRLEVTELSATELIVPRRPLPSDALPQAEASPLALPALPVSVNIGKLAIARADLGEPVLGQAALLQLLGSATLADGAGQVDLSLTHLAPRSGGITLKAGYANATQELALDLSLNEPAQGLVATMLGLPGQPPLDLTVQGTGPITDYAAQIALASDGQPRLAGVVNITRPDTDTRFSADLGGDIAPLFAQEYRAFFGPDVQLALSGSRTVEGALDLDRLALTSDALHLSGQLKMDTQGWPELARLTLDLAGRDGAPVLLPMSGPRTRVTSAHLQIGYDAASGDAWTLRGDLTGLDRPDLTLQSAVLAAGGTLTRASADSPVPGQIEGRVQLSTRAAHSANPALDQAFGGDLDTTLRFDWTQGQPLRLIDIAANGPGFGLSGDATLAAAAGTADLRIETDTTLRTPDLTRFAALAGRPLSGGADLSVKGHLNPVSGAFDLALSGRTASLSVGEAQIDPLLDGTGTLALSARRDADGLQVSDLALITTHARITGSGRLGSRTASGQFSASLTDLARVLPDLSGAASLQAQATRDGQGWTLTATGTGPGGVRAHLDSTGTGLTWDSLRMEGTASVHADTLIAYSKIAGRPLAGAVDLRVSGTGQPARRVFDGTLDLTGRDLAADLPQLDQLLRGASELHLQAARDGAGRYTLTSARLTTPELAATAEGDPDKSLRFTGKLRDLAVLAPGLTGPVTTSGTAVLERDNWRLKADGTGPGGTSMAASGTMAQDAAMMDMALTGTAPLALVNDLIRPRTVTGLASYDLRINGRPALSSVTGRLSTRDARFAIPDQRLALEDISADVTLNGAQAQVSASSRVASGGTVQLSGPIALTAPFTAKLTTRMAGVVITEPRLFETTVDGALDLSGPLSGGAQISGRLSLGQTELRVPNASGTSYADLPGLQHIGEPAAVRQTRVAAGLVSDEQDRPATPTTYGLDLQVLAPDRIFVRGRGLDAELGGSLRLQGTTANVIPQGRFDLIRGRLDILGKRLTLDEGLIRLQGAFDPYIQFKASTRSSDVTASIVIAGQASKPDLSFTSTPELPQDEVLALLLFGRDISAISPLQAVRLAAALRTLAGKGDGLSGGIRKGLALDDLDVTTGDDGATEARAGKYLSENIYSEITADTEGNTQINLNLTINRSVTARGRLGSDGETGIGVFIERDY